MKSFLEFFERSAAMPELAHGDQTAVSTVPAGPQNGGQVARAVVRGGTDDDFDPTKSEVLAWIQANFTGLELAHLVFWAMKTSGVVRWNRETKKWHGDPAYLFSYRRSSEENLARRALARAEREKARLQKKEKWAQTLEERRKRRMEAAALGRGRPGRKKVIPLEIIPMMMMQFAEDNKRQPSRMELMKLIRNREFMESCGSNYTMSEMTFKTRLRQAKDAGQVVVRDGLLCFPPTPAQLAAEAAEREARAAEKAAKEAAKAADHAEREAEIERLRKLTAKLDDRPAIEQQLGEIEKHGEKEGNK